MRESDRIDFIRNKMKSCIEENVKNLTAVTGKLGVEIGNKQTFFDGAKRAAETKKVVQDKNIFWVPLLWKKEIILVAGLKEKEFPKDEIRLLEGLLDQITYDQFLKDLTQDMVHPRSNFIKNLLEKNDITTYEQAIDKGDILGINLRSPQAVILFKVPGYTKSLRNKYRSLPKENQLVKVAEECRQFMHALSMAFEKNENNIIATLEPDLFVILKWARGQVNTLNSISFFKKKADFIKEVVEKETKIFPTIGVGQYYPKLSGLRKSYNDAKVAMELGEKIWGEGKVFHIVDVGMFIALSPKISFERKCELAYQIMGPIFNDKSLYKTVNVFLENDMNLTEAARNLHLHRNTLIYRLDKIKKDIGLDPRKFSDAIQIKLGMILYSPSQNVCEL